MYISLTKEPDFVKDIEAMNKRADEKTAKYGELSNDEINEIIHEHRQRKRRSKRQMKNEGLKESEVE
jgi:hypothetical protein